MFRVIIAGGRDFKDYDLLVKTMNHLLSNIKDNITVVCGKARVPTRSESSMQQSTDTLIQRWPRTPMLWSPFGMG